MENKKKGGFGVVYQEVLRNENLSPESKAIYAYLAGFAGKGNTCYPARKMMLAELGMSETRFSKHMNPLIALGVVSVERERNGNVYGKNIYTISHEIQIVENEDSRRSENLSVENESVENLSTKNNNIKSNNIKNNSINTICSEPKDSEPDKAVKLSGILIPLNNKSFYDVPLDDIVLWRETYPAVDIEGELRRMIAWLNSNPTKRKTNRGVSRFINSWLARTQDNGGSRTQKGEKATSGNNAYDTDAEWNRIKGILKETGTDTDRRQDAPFA